MKFSCEKLLLLSALLTASRASSTKSPVPALEGLHLVTDETGVTITGYDLKIAIIARVEADVEMQGSIILNARLICEIVRKLPGDFVTISVSGSYLTKVTCEMSEYELIGAPSADYPELPSVDNEVIIKIDEKKLKEMITQTNFAVSDNESRMVHTGALFEINDERLTIVAVDGYRMAIRRESIDQSRAPSCTFIVPGTALGEVERIAGDNTEDSEVSISVGSKHIMFLVGDTMLITRRLEGDFLDYKNSVPRENKYHITVSRRALIESVERVSLIISDRTKSPLRCTFSDGVVKLYTSSPLGKASDECEIEGNAEELEIGFNNKYILEALKAAPDDEVRFELLSGVSPCVIAPVDGNDSFLYMVLPVRLNAYEN